MRAEESRVLVVAPVGQDAQAMAAMLRGEGVTAEACAGPGECLEGLEAGAGAVLLTEEALELPGSGKLLESFRLQPAWSDLPLIIVTSGGESRFERLLAIAAEVAGGMTLLERPMREGTLLRSVQVALEARQRQYQVRDLLAERERFRALVTATSEVVYRMSADWKQLLHLQGKGFLPDTESASDRWLERYIHPEDQPQVTAGIKEAIRTKRVFEMEHRILRVDGTLGWTFSRAIPLVNGDGEIVEWFGAASDITEQKRAAEALRDSEERLRMAKSAAGVGIQDYDVASGTIRWDGRVRELWGIGPEEPVTYELFMAGVHPEDRATTQAALERALNPSGDGNYYAEYRVVSAADGRRRWVAATGKVTFENERAVRLVGMVQDITERREFQAELERLVAERTAKLRELVGELEHFSYSITHDMRAPLRAMMGFAEAAKELCSECGHQEQKGFLDRIQTAARRMDLLITDALNYSKAVRSELPLAPVDVGRLLRGIVNTYPELQGAQGGIRIEPGLPLVMGNEAGLTQCFSNLLGNAVKFVRPGEAPEIRVWAEVLADGHGWVRIWVEDRGIGIGPRMQSRVFDMFARGAGEQAGTGIGLALVRKVAERMGGRVGVESEEGKGSRFWVELRSGDVRWRAGA